MMQPLHPERSALGRYDPVTDQVIQLGVGDIKNLARLMGDSLTERFLVTRLPDGAVLSTVFFRRSLMTGFDDRKIWFETMHRGEHDNVVNRTHSPSNARYWHYLWLKENSLGAYYASRGRSYRAFKKAYGFDPARWGSQKEMRRYFAKPSTFRGDW
ncbi:hypothetical protein [Ferrimonas marina]|uniref:Uncharacterized protein n=1 Tax=Ferrimonas marina TaxID=299255 RepID=A0A1M5U3F9_9GAMM|nr:hypothetical protein [Ferrimonas marina]SHH57488.1 hypothetical protein SAMN02745129_2392 [Ferrimonas marina]